MYSFLLRNSTLPQSMFARVFMSYIHGRKKEKVGNELRVRLCSMYIFFHCANPFPGAMQGRQKGPREHKLWRHSLDFEWRVYVAAAMDDI